MKNPIEDIADLDTHYDNESGWDCPSAPCSPHQFVDDFIWRGDRRADIVTDEMRGDMVRLLEAFIEANVSEQERHEV